MNWKCEAVDKLRQYAARQAALENIPEEIERLKSKYSAIHGSAPEEVSVQGGGSQEDALLTNIALREELERQRDDAAAWVEIVARALGCLDEEERLILDRFYIHRAKGHVDRLSAELGVERQAVYNRKDKALRHFTIALYGGAER